MRIIISIISMLIMGQALAENIIRTSAPVHQAENQGSWVMADPLYSDWIKISESNCTDWTPMPENVMNGTEFTQISTCDTTQQRTITNREVNSVTGVYRTVGNAIEENRTIAQNKNRESLGTGNFTEEYFIVGWSYCPYGQYGYSNNGTCGNNVFYEGSVTNSLITYFTYGYNSAINFGTNPDIPYTSLKYLRVEMIDESNNVYYVDEYSSGFMPQFGTYVGPKHSSDALTQSMLAKKFKVTYRVQN